MLMKTRRAKNGKTNILFSTLIDVPFYVFETGIYVFETGI